MFTVIMSLAITLASANDKIYVAGSLNSTATKADAIVALVKDRSAMVYECAEQTLSRKGTLKAKPGDKVYFVNQEPKGTDLKLSALEEVVAGKQAFICTRKTLNPHTAGLTNF